MLHSSTSMTLRLNSRALKMNKQMEWCILNYTIPALSLSSKQASTFSWLSVKQVKMVLWYRWMLEAQQQPLSHSQRLMASRKSSESNSQMMIGLLNLQLKQKKSAWQSSQLEKCTFIKISRTLSKTFKQHSLNWSHKVLSDVTLQLWSTSNRIQVRKSRLSQSQWI